MDENHFCVGSVLFQVKHDVQVQPIAEGRPGAVRDFRCDSGALKEIFQLFRVKIGGQAYFPAAGCRLDVNFVLYVGLLTEADDMARIFT